MNIDMLSAHISVAIHPPYSSSEMNVIKLVVIFHKNYTAYYVNVTPTSCIILHRDKITYMTVYLASKYSVNSNIFKAIKMLMRICIHL